MKKNYYTLLLATLALGAVGGVLRFIFLTTGYDERGLLVSGHPIPVICWIFTILAVIANWVFTAPIRPMAERSYSLPASLPAAIGCILAAIGAAAGTLPNWGIATNVFGRIAGVFGILAALAFGYLAFCRMQGKRPGAVPMGMVTASLMLLLICRYRVWMALPQMQSYVFSLLFVVCLMIACFYRAALDDYSQDLRSFLRWGLAAVFFGLLALPKNSDGIFVLCNVLWLAAELFTLRLPRRPRVKTKAQEEGL